MTEKQSRPAAVLALMIFFRKGRGDEVAIYRAFLESLAGVDLVESEYSGPGVQLAGTINLESAAGISGATNGRASRIISFYFKTGDLALINEARSAGSAPLFRGTWRQGLERVIIEYTNAHPEMKDEERLALDNLLRSLYRK